MGAEPMTDLPHEPRRLAALDRWALAIATALIVLIVAGVLPRITW
jgi:hypothetical protein